MPAPLWVLGAALAGTFTFGGPPCSGDHAATPTTAITDTTPTTSMPGWEQPATVVDVAAGDERFSTLVTAVQAAGLEEALRGGGPFTVFAPTNDAFAALPAGTLDTLLLPENREQLTSILTYHVVAGRVLSGDLTDGMHIPTLDGQTLTVGLTPDGYTLTDASGGTATILNADIEAGNGVVHVINSVLLPAAQPATVVDVAAGDERFSTLVTAIQAAGLEEALRGDGPFTVFAPTNDAFAALPAGTLDTLLLPENHEQLTSILTYHVVAGGTVMTSV